MKNKRYSKQDRQDRQDKDSIVLEGEIKKILNGSMFKVLLENGLEIIGVLSGKMRQFNIKLALGDRVKMDLSPYDLTKGRITYRCKC